MYRFEVGARGRLHPHHAPASLHVAYICREQEGPDAAAVTTLLKQAARTRGREDLLATEHGNLPLWAEDSPRQYFTLAEQYERANGRTATTWKITLPRALPYEAQLQAIRDFVAMQCGDRHPYVWALHEAPALDGGLNPHIHLVVSERTLDGIDRTPAQFFARAHPEAPALGGARKERLPSLWRQRWDWADVCNWHLEQAGCGERVDPRRLAMQGIARHPVVRLSAREFTQAKYRQLVSPALQERLAGIPQRVEEQSQEQAVRQAAWEARKQLLGITSTMTHPEAMAVIRSHVYLTRLQPRMSDAALRQARHVGLRDQETVAVHLHLAERQLGMAPSVMPRLAEPLSIGAGLRAAVFDEDDDESYHPLLRQRR